MGPDSAPCSIETGFERQNLPFAAGLRGRDLVKTREPCNWRNRAAPKTWSSRVNRVRQGGLSGKHGPGDRAFLVPRRGTLGWQMSLQLAAIPFG